MTANPAKQLPIQSLRQRLLAMAEAARRRAAGLPPGKARDEILRKAEMTERSAAVEAWLTSPGLKPPA